MEYRLRSEGDNGERTLKVWRQSSSEFILRSCERRKIEARCTLDKDMAFLITLDSTKTQLEEVREEFNTRPKHP